MSTITEGLQSIFTFPFKGQHWQDRFAVAALFAFILVIPLVPLIFLLGYCGRVTRGVVAGNAPVMPEWNEWGQLFTDGLRILGVFLIYLLPGFVVMGIGFGSLIVSQVSLAAHMNPEDYSAFTSEFLQSMGGMWISYVGVFLAMATGVFVVPATAHMLAKNSFAAAFRFAEWWKVFRASLAGFLIADVLVMGGYMTLTWVIYFCVITVVLCCATPFVMAIGVAYFFLTLAAMFGKLYAEGVQKSVAASTQPQTGVVV